jgi:hypothetical protein
MENGISKAFDNGDELDAAAHGRQNEPGDCDET